MLSYLQRLFSNKYTFYLTLLIAFHVVFNLIWQIVNTAPPTWDSAGHLVLSFIFSDKIVPLFDGRLLFADFLKISIYYPPFIHILGGITLLLFGRNYEIPLFLIETTFFVLAIIFLYKILLLKIKNPRLAFFTVFIFSFFPQVWEQSRHFHLDIPLVSLLLISYFLLIKSSAFRNIWATLGFFILVSLVQLTKWYGFIYLIIPLYYEVIYPEFFSRVLKDKILLRNVLIGVILFFFLTLPWYLFNIHTILENVGVAATADAQDPLNVLSFASFIHYLKLLSSHQVGFISVPVIFISLTFLFFQNKGLFKYIVISILTPYLIFTLIQNKDLRYILPLTPLFAFSIAFLFTKLRSVFLNSYLGYLLFLFLFFSLNQFSMLGGPYRFISHLMGGWDDWSWFTIPTSYSYNSKDWKGESILKDVALRASLDPTIIGEYKVLEIADNRFYSTASLEMYKVQNQFYDMILTIPYNRPDPLSEDELSIYLSDISFALVPVNPGPEGLRNIKVLNQLISYFVSESNMDFEKVATYPLPDGNTIFLYKRIKPLTNSLYPLSEQHLSVYASTTLFLDATKIGLEPYTLHLFDSKDKDTKIILSEDGVLQRNISLEGIYKFRIDLPREKLNIKDLRGWAFRDMNFIRVENYNHTNARLSNGFITPLHPGEVVANTKVDFRGDSIVISNRNPNETVYIAYATTGWVWNTYSIENSNRELVIPVEGLLRIEVTNPNQYVSGFPSNWGYFSCYEGNAVCFYPSE